MTENNVLINNQTGEKARAVLISLKTPSMTDDGVEVSLDELERLLETAGGETVLRVVQSRESPDTATYIGKGKAAEVAEFIKNDGNISLAVVDNELTPSQIANLEDALDVRVIDRTMLILDIFALHATTSEGKLQVEIACLKYTAPRIIGRGKEMSRLGGGIGTRGPGESQLETDRRHLKRRITYLTERLEELERSRATKRGVREKSKIKTVAIAGYTNAGKSTLLNYLTGAGVLSEDKLFATLDPTTRRLTLPNGEEILLTDTVGFIDRLPTHLVKAFKSTLEEIKYANAIVCLVDSSEPDSERARKRKVTENLINELSGGGIEVIWCYNKADIATDTDYIPPEGVLISASTGDGVDKLLEKIAEVLSGGKRVLTFYFPHSKAAEANGLYRNAVVKLAEYDENGVTIVAECEKAVAGRYSAFVQMP